MAKGMQLDSCKMDVSPLSKNCFWTAYEEENSIRIYSCRLEQNRRQCGFNYSQFSGTTYTVPCLRRILGSHFGWHPVNKAKGNRFA